METKMVVKRITKQEEKLIEYMRENKIEYIDEVRERGIEKGAIKVIKDIISPGMEKSLKGLEAMGVMTGFERSSIESSIKRGDNIIIKGGSNRGKTSLMRGVLRELEGRVVVIEETEELRVEGIEGKENIETVSAITLGQMAEIEGSQGSYIVVDGITNDERVLAVEQAIKENKVPVVVVVSEEGYKGLQTVIKGGRTTKVITMSEEGPIKIDGIAEIGGLM